MAMWETDREIYKDVDGKLTTDKSKGVSLYRGRKQRMPLDEAVALGLASLPAHQVTKGIDTKELSQEAKAISEPQENKAIEAPEATKKKKKTA